MGEQLLGYWNTVVNFGPSQVGVYGCGSEKLPPSGEMDSKDMKIYRVVPLYWDWFCYPTSEATKQMVKGKVKDEE